MRMRRKHLSGSIAESFFLFLKRHLDQLQIAAEIEPLVELQSAETEGNSLMRCLAKMRLRGQTWVMFWDRGRFAAARGQVVEWTADPELNFTADDAEKFIHHMFQIECPNAIECYISNPKLRVSNEWAETRKRF